MNLWTWVAIVVLEVSGKTRVWSWLLCLGLGSFGGCFTVSCNWCPFGPGYNGVALPMFLGTVHRAHLRWHPVIMGKLYPCAHAGSIWRGGYVTSRTLNYASRQWFKPETSLYGDSNSKWVERDLPPHVGKAQ